jgi:urease accessory protein
MLVFTEVLPPGSGPSDAARLVLSFEQRQKTRGRHRLTQGLVAGMSEVGLDLPRGTVLRGGDCIACASGEVICVDAAVEQLLEVSVTPSEPSALSLELARIAYHLGNRHVAVQLIGQVLRLELDHVLESMVLGLGAKTCVVNAPFDPETGAYGGHAQHAHRASYADSDQDSDRFKNDRHAPRIHDFLQVPLQEKT